MRNALVVAWKEFKTFFQTPIGYVILVVFTLLGGWFFFAIGAGQSFFVAREASVRGLLTWLPWLFLVFAPAVTMRLWAEERRAGTIETLLTLPLSDWQIVLGKFLAAFALVATWLLCLAPIAAVVFWFGNPDPGPVLGGFIGALLLGGAYAAIGVAASSVTENQIISLVSGVVAAFFFLLIGFDPVVGLFPDAIGAFLYNLSLSTHFHSIARGVLDSRDLLYYASFILFFLVVNVWAVRRQKGRGVTIALVAGILVFANYLCTSHFFRIDLTENGRYTLAKDTKRILGNLDDDLRLTAYLSSDLPTEFTNRRRDVEDLVREFESFAGGHLHVEIVDPAKNEEAKKAAEAAGIPASKFNVAGSDKLEVKIAYLGLVIEFGDKTEKIQSVPSPETLEYDLVRRIAKMTRREEVKVAFQVNDPYGGMNIPGMQMPPSGDKHSPTTDLRTIDQLIKMEYEATTVDLKSKVPDEVKALIVCNSDTLTEVQKFHLDQYLMRGGGLIVMADGSEPMNMGGMGGRGSPMMRTQAEKLPVDFFSHYGFKVNKDLVLDLVCYRVPMRVPGIPIPLQVPYQAAVVAIDENIDQTHPVSASFKEVGFLWTSTIELDPKPNVKAFPLVKTSTRAKKLEGFMDASVDKLQDESGGVVDADSYNQQYLLAGLLEGSFQSYFIAHDVPREVIDGVPSGDPHADEHGEEAPIPFSDLVEPIEPGDAHAKDKKDEKPAAPSKPDPAKDGVPDEDGAERSGGPRVVSADGQEAVPPAVPPAEPTTAPAPAPAPKKEFEYLKQSTAPAKIFVLGMSAFASDESLSLEPNVLFLQSVVDYMAAESLGTLRAKRINEGQFDEPTSGQQVTAKALGWFATPILLMGVGIFVYVWRRTIRPARVRRRMAASLGAAK